MNKRIRKIALITVMVFSYWPMLVVVLSQNALLQTEPLYRISKLAAYFSVVTLWWAYVLGIRRIVGKILPEMTFAAWIHKWLNILGFLLFLAHPIILIIVNPRGLGLLIPNLTSERNFKITLGVIAFLMWAIIWLTSALIKNRMKFRLWKFIHLSSYPILFLGLIHTQVGFLQQSQTILATYNSLLLISYLLLIGWQLLGRLGIGLQQYQLIEIKEISRDTCMLKLAPTDKSNIQPKVGQYVYIQKGRARESHPFTVAEYYEELEGVIELGIKNLGKESGKLQYADVGSKFFVDGPYGEFTQDIAEHNFSIVLLAGGIGITPFIHLLRNLDKEVLENRHIWLFYGNKTKQDMAYAEELEDLQSAYENFDLVHVLDSEPDFEGEKGFITLDLIKKYVGEELTGLHFYMCGPPIMIKKLREALNSSAIPKSQVHFELFSA